MNKVIKKTLIFLLTVSIASMLTIITILWLYSNKLPDYKFLKMYKPAVSSKLYSGSGELVSDFSSEKRIFVPYETIPKIVINSFFASFITLVCLPHVPQNLFHEFITIILPSDCAFLKILSVKVVLSSIASELEQNKKKIIISIFFINLYNKLYQNYYLDKLT